MGAKDSTRSQRIGPAIYKAKRAQIEGAWKEEARATQEIEAACIGEGKERATRD